MAIVFAKVDGKSLQPRRATGEFISGDDCNTHPEHKARLVADVVTGWIMSGERRFNASPDAVNGHLAVRFPSLRRCDPRKGKGSGQGTDTTLFDGVGVDEQGDWFGVNVKMAAADKSGTTAGACVGSTIREPAWMGGFPAELAAYRAAGGREVFVAIRASRDAEGAYLLSSSEVEWHISHPLAAFEAGLPDAVARAGGRGRPAKGAVLPTTWATKVRSTCAEGYSWQLCFRHARTDTSDGWSRGTVADLRAAILAAGRGPR